MPEVHPFPRSVQNAGAKGIACTDGAFDIIFRQLETGNRHIVIVFVQTISTLGAMDDSPGGNTQILHFLQCGDHGFRDRISVFIDQRNTGCSLSFDLVDDTVIGISQSGRHDTVETFASLADHIYRGFDAPLLGCVQQAGHFCAVYAVRFIQGIQQENIANVQQIYVQRVPVDIRLAEISVCTAALIKRTLFGGFIKDDQRIGSGSATLDPFQVDIWPAFHIIQNEITGFIGADPAQSSQRQAAVQCGKVDNVIAQAASGCTGHITCNGDKFPGLRKVTDRIKHIHNHIAGDGNAFFAHGDPPVDVILRF